LPVSLNREALGVLHNQKNLLAFSGGSDSSALFHLLLEHRIPFDIAHVNYHTRQQSHTEARYAQTLAAAHHKTCFSKSVTLEAANFEHRARSVRYAFFHEVVRQHGYCNLITAHQLNDRLEWFLMQLSKGSGLYELVGMKPVEVRKHYTLVRPLLHLNSQTITHYLKQHNITYFMDESNDDMRLQRNYFRAHFATPLLQQYAEGIAKSFAFLDEDIATLVDEPSILHVNLLSYFILPNHRRSTLIAIDKTLKIRGCVMSLHEKNLLKTSDTLVVSRRYVVTIGRRYCFIAPYIKRTMSPSFKEQCRRLKIEPKLRGYLFGDAQSFECLKSLLL